MVLYRINHYYMMYDPFPILSHFSQFLTLSFFRSFQSSHLYHTITFHTITYHNITYHRTNHHEGNKRYRKMVEQRKVDYVNSKRLDKPLVALDIIRAWRAQSPPGRFLKYEELPDTWSDVGDKKAREKTSQALREKAPLLRKQQEEQRRDSGVVGGGSVGSVGGVGGVGGGGNDSPGANGISPDRVGPSMIATGSQSGRGHGHGHGHGHHRSRRGGKGGSGSGSSGMLDRSTGMEPTEVCMYVCMYVLILLFQLCTRLCCAHWHFLMESSLISASVSALASCCILHLASCTSLSFFRNTLNMGSRTIFYYSFSSTVIYCAVLLDETHTVRYTHVPNSET